jgi:hypothetical protein
MRASHHNYSGSSSYDNAPNHMLRSCDVNTLRPPPIARVSFQLVAALITGSIVSHTDVQRTSNERKGRGIACATNTSWCTSADVSPLFVDQNTL